MIEIIIWSLIFILSLFALIKGSSIFLDQAEEVGSRLGLPAFLIGVIIIGVGTSLPELASALSAIINNATDIVIANAVGSNITNILLVTGIVAIIGKRLTITKDLLDSELPFFVTSTVLFIGVVLDGQIEAIEAALLFAMYVIYLIYLFTTEKDIDTLVIEESKKISKEKPGRKDMNRYLLITLFLGLAGLLGGAHFLIYSTIKLGALFGIAPTLISISAISFGTSLPEISVSLKAIKKKKVDLAIGNIFGSSALNILLAVGVPGLITKLSINGPTYSVGLPVLAAASFIFLIIGMARKIYFWEGLMFLLIYIFFIVKLFGF